MQERLFRKKALERLSSPEQLDQLMQVTSSRSWLALLGIILLITAAGIWGVVGSVPETIGGQGILLRGDIETVTAQVSGRLDDIYVSIGETVEQGQVVARIYLPDSNETIRVDSPSTGRIIEVRASTGEFVDVGDPLLNLEPTGDAVKNLEAIVYLPANEGKSVQVGMRVHIEPSTARAEESGVVLGWVTAVGEFPESKESMQRQLENNDLVSFFFDANEQSPIEIRVDLVPSRDTVSGYKWTSPEGADIELQSGTLFNANIILKDQTPLQLIFPFLG